MTAYRAPLQDIAFVLTRVLDGEFRDAAGSPDHSPDVVMAVLTEAARQVEKCIAPLHQAGEGGCSLSNGEVKTPPGYVDAYQEFRKAGWMGVSQKPRYGGAGFPFFVGKIIDEMVCSASLSFSMYPGLTAGCLEALDSTASDEQRDQFCPRLANGDWTGTMCITEPAAGTDIGAIRTQAVPHEDGSYRISGNKIFISSGDHDLSENIVHFVLARVPGDPPGIKGLSTFVVPKILEGAPHAAPGPNAVFCTAVEHKMGLRGSATCAMSFEGARGWLVGSRGLGAQNMFVMMNLARILVGFQGLAQCELATQSAIRYAQTREQGLTAKGTRSIIDHPDVRRMLFQMKAITEGIRVLGYETAMFVDRSRHAESPEARDEAQDWVELCTPILKAFATDAAVELASTAIQVFGGHGYIQEHGVEQILRDAKILCLYEGTNGIQAQDLVRRKLAIKGGRLPERFFTRANEALEMTHRSDSESTENLRAAVSALQNATAALRHANADQAGFASVSYLRAFALTYLGFNWLRTVRALADDRGPAADMKRLTAEFFFSHLLVQVPALCQVISVKSEPFMSAGSEAMS